MKSILVALDFSELDYNLLAYALKLKEIFDVKVIHCVHIVPASLFADRLKHRFPELNKHAKQKAIDQLEEITADIKKGLGEKVDVQVHAAVGTASKKINELVEQLDINLILLGKKSTLRGSGVVAQRLARKSKADLLLVPEGSKPYFEHFLVPIDFSDQSESLIIKAHQLMSKADPKQTSFRVQHVFKVPEGYHYTGKTFLEFSDIVKEQAIESFGQVKESIKSFSLSHDQLVLSLDEKNDAAMAVYHEALKSETDLIMINVKSHSAVKLWLIGSFAERLIHLNKKFALYIAKSPQGRSTDA
ncbi:MAG: universal stress protein [Cyclobacteriaceae bacterium]|nr:universal stress protein [Cyclobacteriaceae bacterium]MCH8516089.1 universal stress protein [Cyclobacteriaceae bacterium]